MIEIRQVHTFDEAAMAALTEPIFGNQARQKYRRELIGARHRALMASLPRTERIRIGSFEGERLIGCSSGWFEFDGSFYLGLSAVDAAHRQQGIYTRMLKMVEDAVRERGGLRISSQHIATNNPVLIPKPKRGYLIAGTEYVEPMGLLVRLVLHLTPERRSVRVADRDAGAFLSERGSMSSAAGCEAPFETMNGHDPVPHYRRWICDASRRYYETRITRDLWGDWHVLRVWGGIGCALGAARSEMTADLGEALEIVERTARKRTQRGYRPV